MIMIQSEGGHSSTTKVTTEHGNPITGITSMTLSFEPQAITYATIEVAVKGLDVMAHPLLGLETVEAAAKAHGYRLVRY